MQVEATQSIANGTYTISSAMNGDLVLDVAGFYKDDCGNVQTYTNNQTPNQQWQVTYLGNGYYRLISACSGKSLDAAGLSGADCTNVQQFTYWGTANQQWVIQDAGADSNGQHSYYIISRTGNSECVDIAGFYNEPCGNVQLFSCNRTSNQKWYFNLTQPVSDGTYTISSAMNDSLVLDVCGFSKDDCANIQTFTNYGTSNQRFTVTSIGNGAYEIDNVNSGKCVDAAGISSADGTNIQQFSYNGTANQKWYILPAGGGYYYIVSSMDASKCLDIAGFYDGDGGNVQLFANNMTSNQKWRFDTAQSIEDGYYQLSTAMDDDLVLDVVGYSTADCANVQIYTNYKTTNQLFHIEWIGDGYYRIVNFKSGKALDAVGLSGADGTNVQQFTYWATANQKWRIVPAGDGTYYLINGTGKNESLTVADADDAAGGNVQLNTYQGAANQRWKITGTSIDPNANGPVIDLWEGDTVNDWGKVAASTCLAILRVQDPTSTHFYHVDEQYNDFATSCENYNIPYGVYEYARYQTVSQAQIEAQYCYKFATANGHNPNFYVVDIEEFGPTSASTNAFIAQLRLLGVTKIGLYMSNSYYTSNADSISKADFLWIPRYGTDDGTIHWDSQPAYAYDMWQYTSKGTVSGVPGSMDLSLINTSGPNSHNLAWYQS